MPLFKNDRRAYIRRRRIFVDSDLRLPRSNSEFDFIVPLDNLLENVVSIELVGYNIKMDIQQTFVSATAATIRTPATSGNNIIDVFMDDFATSSHPLSFSVMIPPRNYTSVAALATDLTPLLQAAMIAEATISDAYWLPAIWSATTSTIGEQIYIVYAVTGVVDTVAVFKFGTGLNRDNSGGGQLGFYTNEDINVSISN